jgi:NlpC/P60 family putative phage cell wall peptidase
MTATDALAERERIVTLARGWLGTPYHHQASVKRVGCDCLGLVRGVYRELGGGDAGEVPPYTADWAEARRHETLLEAARKKLVELAPGAEPEPGDVLVFRLHGRAMAKHAGIMSAADRMIHALEGAGVVEVHLNGWWHRHLAGAFAFPEFG